MPHGEEGLGYLLVGGRSGREAKARDDARRICGHEQTEALVPSQAVRPSDVGETGQPPLTSALGVPDGHSRAVQRLVGSALSLHRCRQMQGHLLDEPHLGAHQPIELCAVGQGRESVLQVARCVAVKVPLASEATPSGEDGEGNHLAGAERRIRPGKPLFLRTGVAEVVHHDVKCCEEGVHVEHEESVPFPSGSGGKPTLICGHLPLKSSTVNSHQAFKGRGSSGRRRKSVPTEEENKASFRRYLEEAWNQGNLEVVDEIFDRYVSHQPDGSVLERGPEDVKRFVSEFRAAFPDLRMNIEEQIAEGDKVMSRGTIRGTHQGEFRGMAPTGEEMKIPGTAVFRFSSEGKVVESWDSYDQLSLMRQNIEQELRVARSIQQALLPQGLPQLEGWQITPYYQPAREVGGDFYDFFELEGGRVGVVMGDATGKGMPAALVVSATSSMLWAVAQALGSSSPGEVLSRVNVVLLARIPPNMFVTCFYAVLDPSSGRLVYANAGHDPPYVRRGGHAEELRARGMPLGLMPEMGYEGKETILQAGEAALFYSDGLVEAHDPRGEMFGFPRLRALVAEHGEERALGASSWRSSTPSWKRGGSRRMTSPF